MKVERNRGCEEEEREGGGERRGMLYVFDELRGGLVAGLIGSPRIHLSFSPRLEILT